MTRILNFLVALVVIFPACSYSSNNMYMQEVISVYDVDKAECEHGIYSTKEISLDTFIKDKYLQGISINKVGHIGPYLNACSFSTAAKIANLLHTLNDGVDWDDLDFELSRAIRGFLSPAILKFYFQLTQETFFSQSTRYMEYDYKQQDDVIRMSRPQKVQHEGVKLWSWYFKYGTFYSSYDKKEHFRQTIEHIKYDLSEYHLGERCETIKPITRFSIFKLMDSIPYSPLLYQYYFADMVESVLTCNVAFARSDYKPKRLPKTIVAELIRYVSDYSLLLNATKNNPAMIYLASGLMREARTEETLKLRPLLVKIARLKGVFGEESLVDSCWEGGADWKKILSESYPNARVSDTTFSAGVCDFVIRQQILGR